jgi:hypothetical protein
MSMSISIHPQGYQKFPGGARLRLETRFSPENANAVTLSFQSMEGNEKDTADPIWLVEADVTAYHLDDATAFLLGRLGDLSAPMRAKLVPIVQHMLDEQAAEAEVEA